MPPAARKAISALSLIAFTLASTYFFLAFSISSTFSVCRMANSFRMAAHYSPSFNRRFGWIEIIAQPPPKFVGDDRLDEVISRACADGCMSRCARG